MVRVKDLVTALRFKMLPLSRLHVEFGVSIKSIPMIQYDQYLEILLALRLV